MSTGRSAEVFGIRHHGPGSTRSLLAALESYQPDALLVEGPADADPLVGWVAAAGMRPPVALLGYVRDQPSTAAFWPFAAFSPEWQAISWALAHGVAVSFCDLPAAISLADTRERTRAPATAEQSAVQHDPLQLLAAAAGYDDAERWWDDVVESRPGQASPFPALADAMEQLRREIGTPRGTAAEHEARREAYMRQTIRSSLKSGHQRVAVVCGAWHAPALSPPLPPAAHDMRLLRGLPKRRVSLTWVPWSHERLASASGYGAGITSPGWYHHLWTSPDEPVARWFTAVARSLRRKDLPVSTAHVIDAVRLAETLAALRGRALAGLSEVTDATRSVLCDGDEVAVRYVTEELVVGRAFGRVSEDVPTVPLEADLAATCRRLRLARDPTPRAHDLDLRRDRDRAKSVLFHRLLLLDVGWARPAESDVQSLGTFRETWQSAWRPEHAVSLVQAAVWGTTVATAAAAKIASDAATTSLPEISAAVEGCLRADLPETVTVLLDRLEDEAAADTDLRHLMDALPPLAQAERYGDVRGTDTSVLGRVNRVLLARICAGLPHAVGALDNDAAAELRRRVDAVHAAVGLLASTAQPDASAARERWLDVLDDLAERRDVNGQLAGRFTRILLDAGRLSDGGLRVRRALSHGAGPAAKAAWLDGFFADGAVLLIHDADLLGLVDAWVSELADEEFQAVLPLVRRTFGTFVESDRRAIAGRVAAAAGVDSAGTRWDHIDLERAAAALQTVRLILGSRP